MAKVVRITKKPAKPKAKNQPSGTRKLAERSARQVSVTACMLRGMGFDVVLVADGNEATEVFEADPGRFVLVLLDLTMLHKDGEHTSRPGQLDV